MLNYGLKRTEQEYMRQVKSKDEGGKARVFENKAKIEQSENYTRSGSNQRLFKQFLMIKMALLITALNTSKNKIDQWRLNL